MKKSLLSLAALAALWGVSGLAQAQSAGSWMLRGGATFISPNVSSGSLSVPSAPGTKIDIDSDVQPTLHVTYMLTDNVSIEVPLGFGYKHKITGDGALAGVGQIGSVKALPITAIFQYRFGEAKSTVRPYVMMGLSYVRFYDEAGSVALNALNPINPPGGSTTLSVDSKFALVPGLGVTVKFGERWFADLSYSKALLKTTAKLSTGQSISARLNPDVFSVGVGYKF